jgi:hypothetical protein
LLFFQLGCCESECSNQHSQVSGLLILPENEQDPAVRVFLMVACAISIPKEQDMPFYNDLQTAVMRNDEHTIHELLSGPFEFGRIELFKEALENEHYGVIATLLEWEIKVSSNALPLLSIATPQNISINSAILLHIHGVPLEQTIGDVTLRDIIHREDNALADYLKLTNNALNVIRLEWDKKLQQTSEGTTHFEIIRMLRNYTYSIRAYNVYVLLLAIENFNELLTTEMKICSLSENPGLTEADLLLLRNEIELASLFYLKYPFYEKHKINLINRLKEIRHAAGNPFNCSYELLLGIDDIISGGEVINEGSHFRLIQLTAAIKESSDVTLESVGGQCLGYGMVIALAMLAGDLTYCRQRLELLNTIPISELKGTLEDNRVEMLVQHQDAKKLGKAYEPTDKQLLFLELEGFLQNIGFGQRARSWAADLDMRFLKNTEIMSVIMPKKIEDELKIIKAQAAISWRDRDSYDRMKYTDAILEIRCFEGHYHYADLVIYLHRLRKQIDDSNLPYNFIVLALDGAGHTITLGYDVNRHCWIFADANGLSQLEDVSSETFVAIKIMDALSFGHHSTTMRRIKTHIYATKRQENIVSEVVGKWENLPEIQAIHNIKRQHALSLKNLTFREREGTLVMAMYSGNLELLRHAVNHYNINMRVDEFTLLTMASKRGDSGIVEFLIANGADVNLADETDIPLAWSLQAITPDVLILLLSAGAQVNSKQMGSLRSGIQKEKKLSHLRALLLNANASVKAEILKDADFLSVVCELLPSLERFAYLNSADMQEYLLSWVNTCERFIILLKSISEAHRFFFFQQENIQTIFMSIPEINVSIIVPCFAFQDVMLFLQQTMIKEKMVDMDVDIFTRVIRCLPDHEIEPFMVQFKGAIQHWTRERKALFAMIKALPTSLIEAFIKQFVIQDYSKQLVFFLEEFNDCQPDRLVECMCHVPRMLEEIQNGSSIMHLLDASPIKVDKNKCIANVVRVFRQLYTDAEVLRKIETQYRDNKSVYELLVKANQNYSRPDPQYMNLSEFGPHLFFNFNGDAFGNDSGLLPMFSCTNN